MKKYALFFTLFILILFPALETNASGRINNESIEVELIDYGTETGTEYGTEYKDDIDPDLGNADNGNSEFEKKDTASLKRGFNKILEKYKGLVVGMFGLILLTLIVWLIYQFCVIGNYSDNPRTKGQKSTQLLLTILAIAILGSFTIWFSLAFNVFR